MKLTTFYKLRKPEGKDVVDVDDFNYNFDEIDTALNDAANASGDLSNGKVFTSMATSRVAPASGDTLAVIASKIMKWLNDLGAAAFRSVANNSTTTADGYVADARALTAVAQRVASLESSFPDGCRIIARAITAGRGTYASPITGVSTADNASPTTMANNIKTLATNNYNAAKVGTAGAGDVIAGKTFTNNTTVGGNGSLADYRNNIQTVATTPTGGTPTGTRPDSVTAWTEDLNVAAGVHNKVRVNKAASYNQGVADADNRVNTNSASYLMGQNSLKNNISVLTQGNIQSTTILNNFACGTHQMIIVALGNDVYGAQLVSRVTMNGGTFVGNYYQLPNLASVSLYVFKNVTDGRLSITQGAANDNAYLVLAIG